MKCMPKKANLSKSQRAILDREIKDEMLQLIDKYNKDYDIALTYALNECCGFGRKRIKRLFKQIISNRVELRRFYADDNNSDSKIDIFTYSCMRKWEKGHVKKLFTPGRSERSSKKYGAVRIIETGETFGSIKECAEHMNTIYSSVHQAIITGCHCRGFHIEEVKEGDTE